MCISSQSLQAFVAITMRLVTGGGGGGGYGTWYFPLWCLLPVGCYEIVRVVEIAGLFESRNEARDQSSSLFSLFWRLSAQRDIYICIRLAKNTFAAVLKFKNCSRLCLHCFNPPLFQGKVTRFTVQSVPKNW